VPRLILSRLIWSPEALKDVQRLHRFLASKNLPAAQRAVKAIRHGVKFLAQQPEAGKPASSADDKFREWPIGFGSSGYIVLYYYEGDTTIIIAVRHQKEIDY
jgi:plasmid stabilization system protein ParE